MAALCLSRFRRFCRSRVISRCRNERKCTLGPVILQLRCKKYSSITRRQGRSFGRGKTRSEHEVTRIPRPMAKHPDRVLAARSKRLPPTGLTRHPVNVMLFALAACMLGRACPCIHGYLLTVFLTVDDATPAGRPVNYCPAVPEVLLSRGRICGIYSPQPRMIRNYGSLQIYRTREIAGIVAR